MTEIEKCMGKEELFAYAHHLLEPDAEREVREHVAHCAACEATVAEYLSLDSLLDDWQAAEPTAWFDTRVRRAVSVPPAPGFTLFGIRWAPMLAAVCLLLLVAIGSLIMSGQSAVQADQQLALNARPAAKRVEEEITLYKDLPVLEDQDFDMIANFEVLSAVPRGHDGENRFEN